MANDVAIKLDLELDLSKVRQQGQSIGNILERAMNKNTRSRALDSLERQIGKSKEQLQKMEKTITDILSDPVGHMDWMTDEFRDAYNEAKKLEDEVRKIATEARKIKPDASLSEIRADLENDVRTVGATRGSRRGTVTGVRFDKQRQIEALKAYEQAMGRMEQEMQNLHGTDKFVAMNNAIDEAKSKLGGLIEDYRRLSLESGNSIQNAVQPLVNFNQEISQTASTLGQAFGPYLQIATTAMSALVEVTKMEIKLLQKFGEVAISAFKPLVSLAEMAATAIGKMFDSIKKHNETTMKNLWRNILRYGIGVRSMYFLIRKIRAAIGDVINELSRQIPEVNAQMSAFKTAVNGLKGALATAFQPILSAVLPALTALINAVSRAIAVIGKFIALLTGQNFVYAATATQVDYAKSLDKTGKSAKKAKKELEGYLSPIDEINKYQTNKNDSDSGGGAGGGDYTLKKVPIEDWIKDFWDRLKKAWQNADFFDIGKMLGDKIAKALASIPWDKIKNEARRLGKSLATFLNGVMYGEYDGKSLGYWIGRTLAEAINTGFEFANQFVKNFDWKKLGQTVVDAVKGVFENLDWNVITETFGELGKGIGETIAKIFSDPDIFNEMGDALGRLVNALVDMIYNFFNQQSGVDIGLAIARFINSAVDQFDPNDFAAMCNKIMEVILNALITAARVTKWDKIGEKIAEWINGIDFKMIFGKYKDLANNIIDGILDMLESFLDTLSADKITEIGESIADFINGLDFQPDRMASVANRLLHALLDTILVAVDGIEWDKIADDIVTFLDGIDWADLLIKGAAIWAKIQEGLKTILGKVLAWIIPELNDIFEKVKNFLVIALREKFGNIGSSIILGLVNGIINMNPITKIIQIFNNIIYVVKKLFGIHSPSTVFIEIGANIVEGFIDGIKSIVDRAREVWENLKAKTIELYENIKQKVVEKSNLLKNEAIRIYENIKTNLILKVTQLKTALVQKYEEIKANVVQKITNLRDKSVELYENIKTKLTSVVENIKSTITGTWESMKSSTISIFESMWSGIKRVINSILAGVEGMANGIVRGLNGAINSLNSLSFEPPAWIQSRFGIGSIGFDIPTLHEISVPRLAQGAVIPPNREFMAVLGDQKSGTNIETPLSTMVEAFNTAMRQNGGGRTEINFLLPDRRKVAQYVVEGGRIMQTSTGKNPFELA